VNIKEHKEATIAGKSSWYSHGEPKWKKKIDAKKAAAAEKDADKRSWYSKGKKYSVARCSIEHI
jgi:hypothetical protein